LGVVELKMFVAPNNVQMATKCKGVDEMLYINKNVLGVVWGVIYMV